MPKNSVADWDPAAINNTDVADINIAEGCDPGNINNAIRAMMAQLAVGPWVRVVREQSFTASGTYTPHANMAHALIECFGGGGGGGGVDGNASYALGAGGGGSGAESSIVVAKAAIGVSQVVTIGAGALGGTGNNPGSSGGATSVGSLCRATGGGGGSPASAGSIPIGGSGSTIASAIGTLKRAGIPGGSGTFSVSAVLGGAISGSGGGLGGAQAVGGGSTSANGQNAQSFSGGGSGAFADRTVVSRTGGAGAAGFVRITEFCTE